MEGSFGVRLLVSIVMLVAKLFSRNRHNDPSRREKGAWFATGLLAWMVGAVCWRAYKSILVYSVANNGFPNRKEEDIF